MSPQGMDYQRSVESSLATLGQLDEVALHELTSLSAGEIARLKREIAGAGRASDFSGFLSHALARMQARSAKRARAEKNLRALFRGLDLVPQGVLGAFVAAPTSVLAGYQKLMGMAGRDAASAFPEGTWQFYLEFALREDAARHTSETVAFHPALGAHVSEAAQAAAWATAVARVVLGYHELLALVWQEHVSLRLLSQVDEELGRHALDAWHAELPYRHPRGDTYNAHRRRAFRTLLVAHLAELAADERQDWARRYLERGPDLLAYQDQMSILAALVPERHRESKQPIAPWRARLAVVLGGAYYLLPMIACDAQGQPLLYDADGRTESLVVDRSGDLRDRSGRRLVTDRSGAVRAALEGDRPPLGYLRPAAVHGLKRQFEAMLAGSHPPAGKGAPVDLLLAGAPRAEQRRLRARLDKAARAELEALRLAPVILHWDQVSAEQPLADLRRVRRGVGDHALTVIRTPSSFVFDQSHVFFDGTWGMAVAEILTTEAIACLRELQTTAQPAPVSELQAPTRHDRAPRRLALPPNPTLCAAANALEPRVAKEVDAEAVLPDLVSIQAARRALDQLGVHLTVNDLLILYRGLHSRWYVPPPALQAEITQVRDLLAEFGEAREMGPLLAALCARKPNANPALLIPMDATGVDPKERLYPTTFRNPLPLSDIGERHMAAYQALGLYRATRTPENYAVFDAARRGYLAHLLAFGRLLEAFKAVTRRGEGFGTAAIRLLGHLPSSLQRTFDMLPQKIGVLNDVLKGEEVFSNVGRVADASSLVRFTSARDDGATKTLVWGVLTDNAGRMHVSLRDFRPHVAGLLRIGKGDLARRIAQDYLGAYVQGLAHFANEMAMVAVARRA